MILSKEESICLILGFSKDNNVSSTTKLNKLLARLNLFFIPIDIPFQLNKYGSFNAELASLESNSFYKIEEYDYENKICHKYKLDEEGKKLSDKVIKNKLSKIMTAEDIKEVRDSIYELSSLRADEISGEEHKKLLVDIDDKTKLRNKLNEILVDLFDLYNEQKEIKGDNITDIKLKALIEYSYYLIRFLKEKRFKNLKDSSYNFDAYMFDYYFLYNLGKIIPFLKEQLNSDIKEEIKINRYYQYLINSVREKYPFSLDNPDLNKLISS